MTFFRPLLAAALLGALATAHADDHGARVPPLPAYLQECGACHVAFPARLLPAVSWQRLMANLPRHFGTDASTDPATTREVATWLQANAATGRRAGETPPNDRITTTAWFIHEHDEVPTQAWKRPTVGKPSNCAACHPRAAEGGFSEHDVRIPR